MARDADEVRDGGILRDKYGRPEYIVTAKHAAPATSDTLEAGTLIDADGRPQIVLLNANGTVFTSSVGGGSDTLIPQPIGPNGSVLGVVGGTLGYITLGVVTLNNGDVTTAKIADGAVTTVKIGDGQVTAAKVAPDVATQQDLTDAVDGLSVDIDAIDTRVSSLETTVPAHTQAISTITGLQAALDTLTTSVSTETTNRTAADSSLNTRVTALEAGGGGGGAAPLPGKLAPANFNLGTLAAGSTTVVPFTSDVYDAEIRLTAGGAGTIINLTNVPATARISIRAIAALATSTLIIQQDGSVTTVLWESRTPYVMTPTAGAIDRIAGVKAATNLELGFAKNFG